MRITREDYWSEVRAIGTSALAECAAEEGELVELVESTCDDHQWIIYTAYHYDVLTYSRNDNAFFDEYDEAPTGKCVSDLTIKLAFSALRADVLEYLHGQGEL